MADLILPNAPKPPVESKIVVPKRKITFGTNRHLRETKVVELFSQVTGLPAGRAIFHGDGRQDAVVFAPTLKTKFEFIPRDVPWADHPNDFRQAIYDRARAKGLSHEDALGLFPDRKVKA